MQLENIGIKHRINKLAPTIGNPIIKEEADDFIVQEVCNGKVSTFAPLLDLDQFRSGRHIFDDLPKKLEKDARKAVYDKVRHFPFKFISTVGDELVECNSGEDIFCCTLLKRNLNTQDALGIIAKRLNISRERIQSSGTKDKRAVTFQEISIKCNFEILFNYAWSLSKNRELCKEQYGFTELIHEKNSEIVCEVKKYMNVTDEETTDKLMLFNIRKGSTMKLGGHSGNCFTIRLSIPNECVTNLANLPFQNKERATFFINYFGAQRFGINMDNHIVGELILNKRFDEALTQIMKNVVPDKKMSRFEHFIKTSQDKGIPANVIVKRFDRMSRMIYMHAFQSYEFNIEANKRIELGEYLPGDKMLVGDDFTDPEPGTPLDKIYVRLSKHNDKHLKGGYRKLLEEIQDLSYEVLDDGIIVKFYLSKSSYATVVLRELFGQYNTICNNLI